MSQLLVLALLLACVCTVRAEERVLAYDIDVEVRADGALDVTERITVNVEGNRIRRGIYRDFPTRYRDRYGNRVVVGLQVLGVERDGANEPWFTENLGNGVRINTGDDSFLPAPAEHTFTLRYRTTRQLGFFGDHDELYWNAIGTGWIFPILSGTVTARLPVPVPVAQMSAEGYTGPQGAKGQAYAAELPDAGTARWHLTQPLAPGEGLTVVLTFPKGIVAAPTTQQRLFWFLRDNRGVLMAAIGWLLLLAFCVYEWRRVGRDPRKGIVIARYEPPEGHGPANLRYLQRMGYDTRCFSAAVLNLAVAGFMRISREPRLIKKDEWRLERGAAGTKPPAPSEAGLLDALFAGNALGAVDLNNKSASLLQRVIAAHSAALRRVMQPRYFRLNGWSIGKAVLIAVAAFLIALMVSGGAGAIGIVVIGVLCVVTLIVFAFLVRAPTIEGRKLMDEVEGFKLYLSVAERDELARMGGPDAPPPLDAKRYETLLPYAVALEVEEAWTKKFTLAVGAAAAAAAANNISWYRGGGVNDLGGFANAIGSSLSSQIASSATPPGSSSGSGGGGSSGGGGGGGGGGGR
ncbi:MAG TPA: DUF2207 domain-containing protein [Povalibacter sp.]|uniref:DUF2207 domain-containing protein n=1 Tax=Povalibacter sp. TaxID=1962978 RepID=UPI002CA89BFF|nr:DUF2207 domain-containing protein [Povalibacter sp.]HMN46677.1 DUF2207 domain-containing protein [Povalibacter sp.]